MIARKLKNSITDYVYAAYTLADGNIGAHNVVYGFVTYLERLDYENRHQMIKSILKRLEVLDRFRLHADRFWDFYKDICKTSFDNLLAFTQGYIDRGRYPGIAEKLNEWYENKSPFDFETLFALVRETNPQLFEGYEPVAIEEEAVSEVTLDHLNALKSKFNKR